MLPEDVIYRYRLRTLALAREIGSVRAGCWECATRPTTAGCPRPTNTADFALVRELMRNDLSYAIKSNS